MSLSPIIFDLESSFIVKGAKRANSIIFEIGAVDIHSRRTFHSFVNPFKYTKEDSLYDAISENRKQKVSSSLHFWHSLLYNKTESSLLLTDKEIAAEIETYNATYNTPSTREMLGDFERFVKKTAPIKECVIIAHNGRSFDFKIIEGNAEQDSFWNGGEGADLYYVDSYRQLSVPMFKKSGGKSGLATLFKTLIPSEVKFQHHRALDDSLATACAIHGMAVIYTLDNELAFKCEFGYEFIPELAYEQSSVHTRDAIDFFVYKLGIRDKMKAHHDEPTASKPRKRIKNKPILKKVDLKLKVSFYKQFMNSANDTPYKTLANIKHVDKVYPISFFYNKPEPPSTDKRGKLDPPPMANILNGFESLREIKLEEHSKPEVVYVVADDVAWPTKIDKKTFDTKQYKVLDVSTLKGVGEITKKKLHALNMKTVQDLINKRGEVNTLRNMEIYLKKKKIYRSNNLAALIEVRL